MKVRKRWTILDVDEESIALIKKYARKNQIHLGLAISLIIKKVTNDKKTKRLSIK